MSKTRILHDSLGEVAVPAVALYGAQTQRAANNFRISNQRLQPAFIHALASIKRAAAQTNNELGLLPTKMADAISDAATVIENGRHADQFIVDVFQTGSGTSTNMNMNEVIATLVSRALNRDVHPNDHVNLGQSSNDVIPTALRISSVIEAGTTLIPALGELEDAIDQAAARNRGVIKTGRTHLMDAMPIRVSDELGGWAAQLRQARQRIDSARINLAALPLGGTAVGTGINTHPDFAEKTIARLEGHYNAGFHPVENRFAAISSQDDALAFSGELRGSATVLLKIANDLRWMNSGPLSGLAEITLPALQPGSSIMPGKVNPVIPEAVAMAAAQVLGYDSAISLAAQSGNFQLNVMQPLVAFNLLASIDLLTNAARHLAISCIAQMEFNTSALNDKLGRNAMLITALAPVIGYEQAAAVSKQVSESDRPVIDVAEELTDISREELERLLDPARLAGGGIIDE